MRPCGVCIPGVFRMDMDEKQQLSCLSGRRAGWDERDENTE